MQFGSWDGARAGLLPSGETCLSYFGFSLIGFNWV